MEKMDVIDLGMLLLETNASTKHVGGVMVFSYPEGDRNSFIDALYHKFCQKVCLAEPFNKIPDLIRISPSWKTVKDFAPEEHVFHWTLPSPGDQQELAKTVARLHESLLARDKPLFEMHLIDGLVNNEFALYFKVHHAYCDGVTGIRMLIDSLSHCPDEETKLIWQVGFSPKEQIHNSGILSGLAKRVSELITTPISSAKAWANLGFNISMEMLHVTKGNIILPFSAQHTPFTGQVSSDRNFATCKIPLSEISYIRKITGVNFNEATLAICDIAIHYYLKMHNVKLTKPFIVAVPVSFRKGSDDSSGGNNVTMMGVELSSKEELHPLKRLLDIRNSHRQAVDMTLSMPKEVANSYVIIQAVLCQLAELLGTSEKIPPVANTIISNVPGPKDELYLNGAALKELYPISTLAPGMVANITMVTYTDIMYVGLVSTHKKLPDLQILAEYFTQARSELVAAVKEMENLDDTETNSTI